MSNFTYLAPMENFWSDWALAASNSCSLELFLSGLKLRSLASVPAVGVEILLAVSTSFMKASFDNATFN